MNERYRFGFHDSHEFRHVRCSQVLKGNGFELQEQNTSVPTKGSNKRFGGSLPTFAPECKKSRVSSQRRSFEAAIPTGTEMSRKYVGHNMQHRLHPHVNKEGTKFQSTDTMQDANTVEDSVEFLETRMDSETGRQNRSGFGLNIISHLGNGQDNNTGVINTCVEGNRPSAKCYTDIRPHKSGESVKKRQINSSENVNTNASLNPYKTLANSTNSVPSCNTVAYQGSLASHVPTSHNALGSSSSQPTNPCPLPIVTVAPHGTASNTSITTNSTASLTAVTNGAIATTSAVSSNSTHVTATCSSSSSQLSHAASSSSSCPSNLPNATSCPSISHAQHATSIDVSVADTNIPHDVTSIATSASATSSPSATSNIFSSPTTISTTSAADTDVTSADSSNILPSVLNENLNLPTCEDDSQIISQNSDSLTTTNQVSDDSHLSSFDLEGHRFQTNINQCDIPSRDLTFDGMTTTHRSDDNLSASSQSHVDLSVSNQSDVDLSVPYQDQQNLPSTNQRHPNLSSTNQSHPNLSTASQSNGNSSSPCNLPN